MRDLWTLKGFDALYRQRLTEQKRVKKLPIGGGCDGKK